MTTDLLSSLAAHTRAYRDRHGEYHLTCPECGHESSPRSPHCSFNPHGWHCFVCGAGGSLSDLAKRVNLETGRYPSPPARLQEAPAAPPEWLTNAEDIVQRCESHSRSWSLWQAYKVVSRDDYKRCRLGVGILPASKCKHERLIVPILDGGLIVGLRGRAISCDCGKWLAPAGTLIQRYPLYNQDALTPGCVAWIVENPIDALLIRPYTGLAIYSVSYWQQRWETALRAARPELVVVALDNDMVGNGGAARRSEFAVNWLQTHNRLPEPAGVRLANRLLKLGIEAVLYDWGHADYKTDIGSLLQTERIAQ